MISCSEKFRISKSIETESRSVDAKGWRRGWGVTANRCGVSYRVDENVLEDFPGGAVVKNPSANAGDTGLIPGL